jgi:hypothetical protein
MAMKEERRSMPVAPDLRKFGPRTIEALVFSILISPTGAKVVRYVAVVAVQLYCHSNTY